MRRRLALLFIFSSLIPLYAQSGLKLEALGARVGWGRSTDLNMNNIIIPGLNANLGKLKPHLVFFGYLDYWNKNKRIVDNKEIMWRVFGISAITKYIFPNQSKITSFIGGGAGFNFGKSEIKSTFDLAIHILGGISVPVATNLNGVVELKYSLDGADYLGIFLGTSYRIR